MEDSDAIETLSALAHPGRLAVFRALVRAGETGLAAGEIARTIGALPNTTSTNLGILTHAGLVQARREGRSVIYAVRFVRMQALIGFLYEDCCGGASQLCLPQSLCSIKAG